MKVSLKSITPDAEKNIVEIARVSSTRQNKSEKIEGLINYLIKHKHWSPFEHSYMTVEIVTSKAIGIQLLRHRSFTFQEFSQRYAEVVELEDFELRRQAEKNRQSSEEVFDPIITDSTTRKSMEASIVVKAWLAQSMRLYKELIAQGVAKECARMVLPMCTQTTIYMTGSIRSWIHFLQIRDDEHAQKEIQLIAQEIKKLFKERLPTISKALNY
jgi:thymidylate synthase (FAD)